MNNEPRTIVFKVSGVTYEHRQDIIARLRGNEPCRVVPEPTNPYDANALAVHVATSDGVRHVGFIPRNVAAKIAPYLDGEAVMADIVEVVGGFEMSDGEQAAYGLRVAVTMPLPDEVFRTTPQDTGYVGELPRD